MQMMKKNNGVTLISLVITILVLGILAGVAIVSTRTTVNDVKDSQFNTELGIVRQAITEQYGKAMAVKQVKVPVSEEPVSFFVGERITDFYDIDLPEQSSIIANADVNEFYNNMTSYSCEYQEDFYYRLSPAVLEQIGINDTQDNYIVNYSTGEVYNESEQVNSLDELLYLPKAKYDSSEENTQDFNDWEE